MRECIARRRIEVTRSDSPQIDEYEILIHRPYQTEEYTGVGMDAVCIVEFGFVGELIEHDLPGFDELEALANALAFADFFFRSLPSAEILSETGGRLAMAPSEFSQRLRDAFGEVLGKRTDS